MKQDVWISREATCLSGHRLLLPPLVLCNNYPVTSSTFIVLSTQLELESSTRKTRTLTPEQTRLNPPEIWIVVELLVCSKQDREAIQLW